MQYLLSIYSGESAEPQYGTPEFDAMLARYSTLTDDMKAAGVYLDGRPLEPVSAATTVRIRDGKRMITDGPFAETKEQLGGFYLVDCVDLDDAIEWAGRIPAVEHGSIEVRPIMNME